MHERKIIYTIQQFDLETGKHVKRHILKNTDLVLMRKLFGEPDPYDPMWGAAYEIRLPEQVVHFEKVLGEKLDLKKYQYTFEAETVDWQPGDRKKTVHVVMRFEKGRLDSNYPSLFDVEKPDLPAIRKLLVRPSDDPLHERTSIPPKAAPYFEELTKGTMEKFDYDKYDYFFGAEVRYADA